LFKHERSGDISWQKIGGELNPFKTEAGQFAQRFHELGFSEAGQPFEEEMSAGEQAAESEPNKFLLAKEHLLQLSLKLGKHCGT
jgi:hypothetical protein